MTVSLFFSKQSPQLDDDLPTRMPMPNVFVVPPEEDQSPTWCFFDANQPALSHVMEPPESPTINVFNSPIDEDTPEHHRNYPEPFENSGMPRRSSEQLRSVVDALTNDDDDIDTGFDTESEYEEDAEIRDAETNPTHSPSRHESIRTFRNIADDSDVVEVVKVRRSRLSDEMEAEERVLPPVPESKRSNTLKSRASKAFRSLRGSLRSSKPRAQDIFPLLPPGSISQVRQGSAEETQSPDAFPRPPTPTVLRRSSILSQLFTASSLKSRSSVSSFDDSQPISSESTNSLYRSFTQENVVSSPTSAVFSTQLSIRDCAGLDEARLQATSPAPTTTSTKSSSRRFSMLNLQRLFSFSSATPVPTPASSANPASSVDSDHATLRSSSRTSPSATSSISTTSGPQTPTSTEEGISVHLATQGKEHPSVLDGFESAFETNKGLNLDIGLGFASNRSSQPQTPQVSPSPSGTIIPQSFQLVTPKRRNIGKNLSQTPTIRKHLALDDDEADTSLEMRLDSLHFDSLSFDADQFNIPTS